MGRSTLMRRSSTVLWYKTRIFCSALWVPWPSTSSEGGTALMSPSLHSELVIIGIEPAWSLRNARSWLRCWITTLSWTEWSRHMMRLMCRSLSLHMTISLVKPVMQREQVWRMLRYVPAFTFLLFFSLKCCFSVSIWASQLYVSHLPLNFDFESLFCCFTLFFQSEDQNLSHQWISKIETLPDWAHTNRSSMTIWALMLSKVLGSTEQSCLCSTDITVSLYLCLWTDQLQQSCSVALRTLLRVSSHIIMKDLLIWAELSKVSIFASSQHSWKIRDFLLLLEFLYFCILFHASLFSEIEHLILYVSDSNFANCSI